MNGSLKSSTSEGDGAQAAVQVLFPAGNAVSGQLLWAAISGMGVVPWHFLSVCFGHTTQLD